MAYARATFDFFEAQRAARRRTFLFLLFWLAAIPPVAAFLGAAIFVVITGVTAGTGLKPLGIEGDPIVVAALGAALAAAGIVLASARKAAAIARGGGRDVARSLDATPLDSTSADVRDQVFRNVVEEMAIASGLPVPELYVLRDVQGINAFAAGYAPDRAVIAVTQGCLDRLTRDELQGIIGHELSHLRNGDTLLNLRLVSLIHGLTAVAALGRGVLQVAWQVGSQGQRRWWQSRRKSGGVELALGLVGVLLLIAGSVGAFFGTLITAAVSRQREFLADAASAQFTRDPESLGRALRKILVAGSELGRPNAAAFGHLFFASGLKRWRSTHPPVEERVRRLLGLPWDAKVPPPRDGAPPIELSAADAGLAGVSFAAGGASERGPPPAAATAATPNPATPNPAIVAAARLIAALPPALAAAAREPSGARAICCAVLLDARPDVRARQLSQLGAGPEAAELTRLAPLVDAAGRARRLALLDLALPALGALSTPQRQRLQADMKALASADGRITVGEWVLLRVSSHRLDRLGGSGRPRRPRPATVDSVAVECRELLGLLAWVGNGDEAGAQRSFDAGVAALGVGARWKVPAQREVGPARIERALAELEPTPPALRSRVIAACEACAAMVGGVDAAEAELLRALAISLGVPAPARGLPTAPS